LGGFGKAQIGGGGKQGPEGDRAGEAWRGGGVKGW